MYDFRFQVILLFGSEQQKEKYLPLLATGEKIAALCAVEPQRYIKKKMYPILT